MTDKQRAILTTWLLDRRQNGNENPGIGPTEYDDALGLGPKSLRLRLTDLLDFLARRTASIGQELVMAEPSTPIKGRHTPHHELYWLALAWSESVLKAELDFLLDSLRNREWVNFSETQFLGSTRFTVTLNGFDKAGVTRV